MIFGWLKPTNLLSMKPPKNPYSFELESGRLDIEVERAELPFPDLCAVASRLNAKRPFIFISKVLGKHWPTTPQIMSQTYKDLARELGPLKEPALFIAMAETAIGFGRGVFAAYGSLRPSNIILFSQTTRYNLEKPLAFQIDELHSHARDHLIYWPETPEARKLFQEAQTLVLIDDEISTGRTLLGLVKAYADLVGPKKSLGSKKTVWVSLTNWLSPESRESLKSQSPFELSFVDLLAGQFQFTPSEKADPLALTSPARSVGDGRPLGSLLAANYGRLGLTLPQAQKLDQKARELGATLNPVANRVRVIGAGEFLYEPYTIAQTLESRGFEVSFQATTRTPLALGGAISQRLAFLDNYGEGLDNFLYNAEPNFAGQTYLVLEAPPDPKLLDLLSGQFRAEALVL
ncbi:MAG: phosphoribosyltransferase domain-containing protein [Deltaproteobacteria bacterium]|jgi:hypothetical protein|nr:phosphoribosyltransferase domain-containing protein [Deltaproteobacteria bacterium]